MMIILLILITLSLDSVWILLGENCCWSLLGLKGLTKPLGGFRTPYQVQTGVKQFRLREMPAYINYTKFNPLSPKSDQHQISPCNINALRNRIVMRITDMITQDEFD